MPEPLSSSILGVAICLLSLAFATLAGLGVLSLLRAKSARHERFRTPEVLLAPALGFAVFTIPAVWLNLYGLPVGTFAYALFAAIVAATALRLIWVRASIDLRRLWPFALVVVVAMLLIGRPLLEYGIDWVSFGNHDMTTYCSEAQRQIAHGFYQPPNATSWIEGSDFPQYYLSYYAFGNSPRAGADTLLALVAVLARMLPLRVYMPLLIALTGALVASVSALTYRGARGRATALVTAGLVSCAALVALGTTSQLYPQVFGLSLLAAALAEFVALLNRPSWGPACATAILAAALVVVYPETLPFLAGSAALYMLVAVVRHRLDPRTIAKWSAASLLVAGVLFLPAWRVSIVTLINQIPHGTNQVGAKAFVIFPYFLIPIGPAMLFGLLPIGATPSELFANAVILIGLAVLGLFCMMVVRGIWRSDPCADLCAIMLALAVVLFVRRADFGLYKLAMFVTPFAFGVFAAECTRFTRRSAGLAAGALLALLVSANLIAAQFYVERSRGVESEFPTAALTEIANASPARVYARLSDIREGLRPNDVVLSDTSSWTVAEIEGAYTQGFPLYFFSYDWPERAAFVANAELQRNAALRAIVAPLESTRRSAFADQAFLVSSTGGPFHANRFEIDSRIAAAMHSRPTLLLESSTQQSVLNRWYPDPNAEQQIEAIRIGDVRNHLVFVNSSLGEIPLLQSPDRTGLDNPQPAGRGDARQSTAAGGRYILLMALGFRGPARFEFWVNDGPIGEGRLPPAVVYGRNAVSLDLAGRGSARAITGVVEPRYFGPWAFYLVDAGSNGFQFSDRRRGLMNLYGRDIRLNWLRIAWLVRDISLVPANSLERLQAPSLLTNFSGALQDHNLLFSGIYDDGWLSDRAVLHLKRRAGENDAVVDGLVPLITSKDFSTNAALFVDGRPIGGQNLAVGYFKIKLPLPSWVRPGDHAFEVRFDKTQALPSGDGRVVAALPSRAGFDR